MSYKILQGDNRETLKTIPDNSIDAIVTDPPYGIDFLGKSWDANTGALETYQECLRVLKPGGHILAFSAARTYHHLAITLEQAGFEIRDQIMWIYSSGFPKSQDIGKSIDRQSGKAAHKADLAEVKAILKQLYKDSGKSNTQIDRECGFNACGYLKTDFKDKGWANNLPKDDKWITLKGVLGCGDDYDDYFLTTPQIKVGEKETGCFGPGSDYTIGGRGHTVDITKSQTAAGAQWAGWGTALKPAHEPIALARKPIKLSIAKNAQKYGVGALNIDAARIPIEGADTRSGGSNGHSRLTFGEGITSNEDSHIGYEANEQGRFPSNVLGEILQADYQKYFYCPKVSRKERHIGFDTTNIPTDSSSYQGSSNGGNYLEKKQGILKNWEMVKSMGGHYITADGKPILEDGDFGNQAEIPGYGWINLNGIKSIYEDWCKKNNVVANHGNNHPTVKPIELMKYLIKLITPPGGTVLDPFNGSGSTGCAAVELGHPYIGCELDPAYVEIAEKRIAAWINRDQPKPVATTFEALFQ
jgi:DNA modification methylase